MNFSVFSPEVTKVLCVVLLVCCWRVVVIVLVILYVIFIVIIVILVVVVSDTYESVCMCTSPQTCKLQAN